MEYKAFKGRSIDFSQTVEIYKNLHNGLWSVRQNGLIVAHVESFVLKQVFFKVSESGRQRVIAEQRKNVHAFICGLLDPEKINFLGEDKKAFHADLMKQSKLSYNPYFGPLFHIKRPNQTSIMLMNAKFCMHKNLVLIGSLEGIAAIQTVI